jgi:hypothetical protein
MFMGKRKQPPQLFSFSGAGEKITTARIMPMSSKQRNTPNGVRGQFINGDLFATTKM